jgi:AmmeMemoRadiSam system protein A
MRRNATRLGVVFQSVGLVAVVKDRYNGTMDVSADDRRLLLDVARQTIRRALGGSAAALAAHERLSQQRAGCFVSLHTLHSHRLRGCVGRLDDREALLVAVAAAAMSVLEDPRFLDDPVRPDELPALAIELTLISPLRPAPSCLEFEPSRDGIYLKIEQRGGCFLPQVARETGWSRQELLSRLCTEKMGLAEDAWRHPNATLLIFDTILVGPEPFES